VASVLALWLLVRPPDLPGEESTVQPQPTALNTTQAPSGAPGSPTQTLAAEATPTPAPETPAVTQYTVVEGDTWFGIAEVFGVDAEALAAANGKTLDDFIIPGDVLVIPQ
jgi:LysM repeat protein